MTPHPTNVKRVAFPAAPTGSNNKVAPAQIKMSSDKDDKKIIIIVISAILGSIAILLFGYYLTTNSLQTNTKPIIAHNPPGAYLELPEIKTNLTNGSGVIQTTVVADIAYSSDAFETDSQAIDETKKYLPVMTNAAISTVSEMSYEDLRENGPELIQKKVKKEINRQLKEAKSPTKVKSILIQDLIYQN